MIMKTRRNSWLVIPVVLSLVLTVLWLCLPSSEPTRLPSLNVSPLLTVPPRAASVIDPLRTQRLDKSPDLLERARAAQAHARNLSDANASRDAAARQILAGLKTKADSSAARSTPPLSGRARGTGQQVLDSGQQEAVDALIARLGPTGALRMDSASATLRHLRGDLSSVVAESAPFAEARARGDFGGMALATVAPLGRVMKIQKPEGEFVPHPSEPDDLGMVHVRMDQQYQGIPIYGAQVIVHFNAQGQPVEIGGTYAATPASLGVPQFKLKDETVVERAQAAVNASGPGQAPPRVTRAFYWNPNVSPVPAYIVDLAPSVRQSWRVILRADDGTVLRQSPTTYQAAAIGQSADLLGQSREVHCWQQGSEYLAIDTSLPMYAARSQPPVYTNIVGAVCVFDVKDEDVDVALKTGISYARATNPNQWDATAVSVMSHFGAIFNYYQSTHNRTSFDGKGINITGLIHCRFKDSQGQLY